jgi:hypothetical protein
LETAMDKTAGHSPEYGGTIVCCFQVHFEVGYASSALSAFVVQLRGFCCGGSAKNLPR